MIAAGNLDRRITLQRQTPSRDSVGGVVETWTDVATVWASVRSLSGKESAIAQQVQSQASLVVGIRWRNDISNAMRVQLEDGRSAQITWQQEIGRKERLNLYCEVVDARN
jgi:SPP1 family predicted phage head-tail adaptor